MSQPALTVPELCERWRVAPQTVRDWIASGELKAFNLNAAGKRPKWRIEKADVERFRQGRSNIKRQPRPAPRVKPVWEAEGLEEFV